MYFRSSIFLQAQKDLVTVKRDLSLRKISSPVKELCDVEEERDLVTSDLRRVQQENESLRDKIKVFVIVCQCLENVRIMF